MTRTEQAAHENPRWRWPDAVEAPLHYATRIASIAGLTRGPACSIDGCACCARVGTDPPITERASGWLALALELPELVAVGPGEWDAP